MSLRSRALVAAWPPALLAMATALGTGCNSQGHSGDACEAEASALYPTYSCNTGLVCNTGEATPTCEEPNAQGPDGPCGDDVNCQSGLYCAVSRTCEALLAAGAACPYETGCGAGLVCANVPQPTCVAADAGPPDATVATVTEGGDDASESTDAAASDSAPAGDAACDASGDAGPCPL
jgi:hypothetical protein